MGSDQQRALLLNQLEANPQRHVELASMKALDSRTWNHPILARGRLVIRNASEAVC